MIRYICLILFMVSCTSQEEKKLSLDISFKNIYQTNKEDYEKLKEEYCFIQQKYNRIAPNDSITMEYLKFLESIELLCENSKNPFFKEGKLSKESELGIKFIIKTKALIEHINKNEISERLKQRAYILLNVEDIKYEEGETKGFVPYLDYYFRGFDSNVIKFLILERKRNVILIQNEILYNKLLTQDSVNTN